MREVWIIVILFLVENIVVVVVDYDLIKVVNVLVVAVVVYAADFVTGTAAVVVAPADAGFHDDYILL